MNSNEIFKRIQPKNSRQSNNLKESFYEDDEDDLEAGEKDLVKAILFIKRLAEWIPKQEKLDSMYLWAPQEHVRRALLYGKPRNEEELMRLLIPDNRGFWMHKIITKGDIIRENMANKMHEKQLNHSLRPMKQK